MIRREWASFLEMNDSPEITPSLLWETGKAVLRGKVISYSSHKKKQQQELENNLEHQIKHLTNLYSNNPSGEIQNKLRLLKTELESILHKKTEFLIQQLKLEQFLYSNKTSKLLTNLLQHKKEKALIPSILDHTGNITQNPQEINNVFYHFYSNLYSSNHDPNQPQIESFLNNLELPSLSKKQVDSLDLPITIQELKQALDKMPNNKSPGPDGFPVEFYKYFWDILSPLFLKVTTEIKTTSTIPTHMNTAVITLVLKPNKDPIHPSSYRPISLINTDLKIITKTLASRIELVTPILIHPDQTGTLKIGIPQTTLVDSLT